MRKEYGNELRKQFTKRITSSFPDFEEIKIKSLYSIPGERVYRKVVSSALHLFITLVPQHSGDSTFTIELGWSKQGRFPELMMRPSLERPDEEGVFEFDEYLCRLLALTGDYNERFWRIGNDRTADLNLMMEPITKEQAQIDIEEALNKYFPLLDEYASGFFNKIS